MRQSNFKVGYTAGQRKGTISHSDLLFLVAQVPLPHACQTYQQLSTNPDARKPGLTTSSTKSSDFMRKTAHRAANLTLICNDQQPETLKQLHFAISLTKILSLLSVAFVTGEETSHNISGLSSICENIQSVINFQMEDGHASSSHYLSPNHPAARAFSVARPAPLSSHSCPSSSISRHTATPITDPFQDHPNLPKTIIQLPL